MMWTVIDKRVPEIDADDTLTNSQLPVSTSILADKMGHPDSQARPVAMTAQEHPHTCDDRDKHYPQHRLMLGEASIFP